MNSTVKIPSAMGLPLIGHLPAYQSDRLSLLLKLRQDLGPRFKIKIGPKLLTVLTSPDDLKQVMRVNIKNYYKKTNFDQLFGIGVFTSNDDQWKVQRKIVQPLFGPRYIESCVPVILELTASNLDQRYSQDANNDKNIYDFFARSAFDIIIATVIGIDYSEKFQEINDSLNFISEYLTKTNYLPFQLPHWLDKGKAKYEASQRVLDTVIFESIEAQRSLEQRKDSSMISLMLEAQEQNTELDFSAKRVRDNIITLMFAGYETSALTLSWMTSLLGNHPKIQDNLYQEIKDLNLESVKIRDLEKYPYLDAVVNETLRMFPAGWAWSRIAKEADEINGHQVEPGEIIFISPFLTHRDAACWPDPNKFKPERFLNLKPGDHPPFAFFPFGGGPRICVGKQFAILQIKLMISLVLQKFKIEADYLPTPSPLATLQSREGFPVSLEVRK